ncbi:MAG TPA: TRAP transporter substrate-binding protein [Paenirhodobacter sp.]
MHLTKRVTLALATMVTMSAGIASAETKWVMPSGYPESNFFTQNLRAFIADVDKETNGELKIDLRPNDELMKLDTVKRAVQSGQVPIGEIRFGIYGNEDAMNVLDSVPSLAGNYVESRKLIQAQIPYYDKTFGEKGLKILSYEPWPGQGFFTKFPVNSVDDFKGVSIRIYSASTQQMAELLGFNATILPFAEVPQAFSTGLIQSLFTSAQTGVDIQAWDYAKHFTYSGSMLNKNGIIVNKRAFDKLSPEVQAALVAAGERATDRAFEMSKAAHEATVATLAANGMAVVDASPDLQARLKEIGDTMTADWAAKATPEQKAVLDAYLASLK